MRTTPLSPYVRVWILLSMYMFELAMVLGSDYPGFATPDSCSRCTDVHQKENLATCMHLHLHAQGLSLSLRILPQTRFWTNKGRFSA